MKRPKPLSKEEQNKRKPRQPEDLVGASQETGHIEIGETRRPRVIRIQKEKIMKKVEAYKTLSGRLYEVEEEALAIDLHDYIKQAEEANNQFHRRFYEYISQLKFCAGRTSKKDSYITKCKQMMWDEFYALQNEITGLEILCEELGDSLESYYLGKYKESDRYN